MPLDRIEDNGFNNGDQRLYSSIDIIDPPLDTNNSYLESIWFQIFFGAIQIAKLLFTIHFRLQNGNTFRSGFYLESQTDSS